MPTFPEFVRHQLAHLPLPSADAIQGRTYVVTGANTGLGFECAKHLIGFGAARVILAVRSLDKGRAAKMAIERAHPHREGTIEVWPLDLASLDSVEAFAERLGTMDRLDALVSNAGVGLDSFSTAEGGIETSLVVNVLGTMLLVLRAMPVLRATAKKYGVLTRSEVVTSGTVTWLKEEDIEALKGNVFDALSEPETMNFFRYPTTKLFQTFLVQQLASLAPVSDTGVIVNNVNPGLCSTSLGHDRTLRFRIFAAVLRLLLGRSAEVGSRTLLHGAVAEEASHGQWLDGCQIKKDYLPDWIGSEKGLPMQKRIWDNMLATLAAKGHKVDVDALLHKA